MRSIDGRLRRYVALVSIVGAAALAGVLIWGEPALPSRPATAFWVLALLVVVGEVLPVPVAPRHPGAGGTTSTSFAFAILLGWGLPAGALVQTVASLVADGFQRKAWYKAVFNAAQYCLSITAAGLVLAAFGRNPLVTDGRAGVGDVLVLIPAGLAFFVVNNVLTGVVMAMAQNARVAQTIGGAVRGMSLTEPILIALAPVFAIVGQTSPAVLPLLLLPIVGVYVNANISLQKEHQALHDTLTGLPNRTMFRSQVAEALAASKPEDRSAVLLIDLDRFKEVNDTLGHATGDRMLQALGPMLVGAVREGDIVARLGGDEFGAFLPRIEDDSAALEVARRIRAAAAQPFVIEGVPLFIEASVGIAIGPDDGADVGTLLRRADVAMYLAKEHQAGYERYSAERDLHSLSRLSVLGELRSAIDIGEIVLHYQPKVEAGTGEVVGVEALVRWRHPTRGLLYPADFLQLAERSGLILDLTDRVLEQGVGQAMAWEREGMRVPVAANLSVRSLDDETLPARIMGLLSHAGARPEFLSLELTESTVMADPKGALRVLTPLSEMGVRISIDDFGTGYSSLSYLTQLPISEIKIDRSFMTNILDSATDAIVVRSTIDLAHDLGLEVVAEGVESRAVCELLAEYGCDAVQGFYVQRPVPEGEFTTWFRSTEAAGGAGLVFG
jgi:diguanylate cyclase (GGDEF)-like protein